MARSFSKSQRNAVEIVTGRQGEADHVKPYSKGGETTVENCQILTPEVNRRKSDFFIEFRKWQKELFREWDKREPNKPFMLIAIPGGGKTYAALEIARRWMQAGADRRLIVVVPTDNLREQWRDEAERFGVSLQSKEFGANFKHGFEGGVVTYSRVANEPSLFNKLCHVAPTMVIFDEMHHCGENAHFGIGAREAFQLSAEKLLLSGTPWKSDGTSIPFVNYDANGFAIGDFSYDYPRALNENVVRYLWFDHSKGTISNDVTGETEVLSQEITKKQARKRLRRILDPSGDYVRDQIIAAHRKLIECRKVIPDAGALAACIDQDHARKVANAIREATGVSPSVILSEYETDSVKEFRNSKKEWLVAVRKVSEGTDIKRLQVLCYLTNTTSELFFRQLVGRVSRFRDMDDFDGYVYLPADPRLIACAKNIENAQARALKEENDRNMDWLNDRNGSQQEFQFESYSTRHDGTELVLIGNETVPMKEYREIELAAESVGVSMQKALMLKRMFSSSIQTGTNEKSVEVECKEDRIDKIRRKCSKMVNRLAGHLIRKHGGNFQEAVKQIHGRFKKHELCSEEELNAKLEWLVLEINKVVNQ